MLIEIRIATSDIGEDTEPFGIFNSVGQAIEALKELVTNTEIESDKDE